MSLRGTNLNPKNEYFKTEYSTKDLDEEIFTFKDEKVLTTFYEGKPKTIVNEVTSPDVGMSYSLNPYQGCEHGCIYCYARNSHQYWGFSAGLDFESKIIIKKNAPELFEKFLNKKNWKGDTIGLSGNTDCYQPIEAKLKLTRRILEIASEYNQPIGIITKNSLILRDIDIIQSLAKRNLICVYISITGVDEKIRAKLEPRTSTYKKRFEVLEQLTHNKIPCGVMFAPIIPAINDHQMYKVLEKASLLKVPFAGYTVVRLDKHLGELFEDWLEKYYPDKKDKVWDSIKSIHGGQVGDVRFKVRMKGQGLFAETIAKQFMIFTKKLGINTYRFQYDHSLFAKKNQQLTLFQK